MVLSSIWRMVAAVNALVAEKLVVNVKAVPALLHIEAAVHWRES